MIINTPFKFEIFQLKTKRHKYFCNNFPQSWQTFNKMAKLFQSLYKF